MIHAYLPHALALIGAVVYLIADERHPKPGELGRLLFVAAVLAALLRTT